MLFAMCSSTSAALMVSASIVASCDNNVRSAAYRSSLCKQCVNFLHRRKAVVSLNYFAILMMLVDMKSTKFGKGQIMKAANWFSVLSMSFLFCVLFPTLAFVRKK